MIFHIYRLDAVNVARDEHVAQGVGERVDGGAVHLAVDSLGHYDVESRVAQTPHGLFYLATHSVDINGGVGATLVAYGVDTHQESLDDIEVVGTAESVVGTEHYNGHALYLAGRDQRRIEIHVSGQYVAHDRLQLVLEGLQFAEGRLVLVHLGR